MKTMTILECLVAILEELREIKDLLKKENHADNKQITEEGEDKPKERKHRGKAVETETI